MVRQGEGKGERRKKERERERERERVMERVDGLAFISAFGDSGLTSRSRVQGVALELRFLWGISEQTQKEKGGNIKRAFC